MSLLHVKPILFQINADDFGTGLLGWVGWTGGDGAVLMLFVPGLYPVCTRDPREACTRLFMEFGVAAVGLAGWLAQIYCIYT